MVKYATSNRISGRSRRGRRVASRGRRRVRCRRVVVAKSPFDLPHDSR